ncbi:MAG TPA: alpha/beta fold hydrolase [Candidatus Eisenbacteria bacterium]|nr:alpha/beta fold hydrolase [Candidatus Eisenbacteria bacterium]
MPIPSRTRFGAATAALALVLAASALAGKPAPLAVQESGSGSPTIVLVHSIGGDRNDWSAVAPRLAEHHRVLIVELPGHGQSPAPDGAPTVEGASASLAKTLADRKVEHAILVGHSYGALVALKTAADQPKRARAVVAVDAATYTPADSVRIAEADRVLRERYTVFLSAVYQAMTKNPATGDSLLARAMRVEPSVLTEYFHDSWREDLRPAIRSLKTPVHLVATEGLWPSAESWTSARKRLGYETAGPAEGHRVAESAHMVALDQPDSLAAIIEAVAAHP